MFEASQNQIDLFLEKNETVSALPIWWSLHKSIAKFSQNELDRHIKQSHDLAKILLQNITVATDAFAQVDQIYSHLQSACLGLPFFDSSRELTFYDTVTKIYLVCNYHEQALKYGSQGLWFAEKLQNEDATRRFKILLDRLVIECLTLYLDKIPAAYQKLETIKNRQSQRRDMPTDFALTEWQQWRQELHNQRQNFFNMFESHPDLLQLQREFSRKLKRLLNKPLNSIEDWLGKPPCAFCIALVGSLSRGDALPYSDIDFFILVENKAERHHPYFQSWIKVFCLYINLMGEPNGLRIDSGDLGYLTGEDKLFLTTPEDLAAHFNPTFALSENTLIEISKIESPEAYAMHRPTLLYASNDGKELLNEYIGRINEMFKDCYKAWAQRYFILHMQQWKTVEKSLQIQSNQPHSQIKVKEHLLQPLLFFCIDLALYCGKVEVGLLPALQTAKIKLLDSNFQKQLLKAIEKLQRLRIRRQKDNRQESMEITISQGSDAHRLLMTVQTQLLLPLQRALEILKKIDFPENLLHDFDPLYVYFMDALENLKRKEKINEIIQLIVTTLLEREATVTDHLKYYAKLPSTAQEIYIKKLHGSESSLSTSSSSSSSSVTPASSSALIETLKRYPDFAGVRLSCLSEQQKWEEILLQLTELTPPKVITSMDSKPIPSILLEWVTSKGEQKRYLKIEYAKQLFLSSGKFNEENKATDGKHYVKGLKNSLGEVIVYVKAYPELPGIQIAVDSLSAHISGNNLKSTLVKCTNSSNAEVYPLLISQAVPGETLQNLLRQKGSLQDVEENLDAKNFTLKILEDLVIRPEDHKPENLVAQPFTNTQQERKFRLISIDGDHAFVEPLVQTGLSFNKKEKVQVKSIIYCFQAMKNELNPEAVAEFLNLDPFKMLQDWLFTLKIFNQSYQGQIEDGLVGLFDTKQIGQFAEDDDKKDFCFIPVFFEPGTVSGLYEMILRLQALLKDNLPSSHLELLGIIEPRLAAYYEKVFAEHVTADKRFHALPTEYVVVAEPQTKTVTYQSTLRARKRVLQSITITTEKKKKILKQALAQGSIFGPEKVEREELAVIHNRYMQIIKLKQELLQGNLEGFEDVEKGGDYLRERIINSLDFSSLEAALTKSILEILPNISFQSLCLKGCLSLTDVKLESVLKNSPGLYEIDLSDCPLLTDVSFFNIATYCKGISKVVMERTNLIKLEKLFARKTSFPALRTLKLSRCGQLTILNIDAPKLDRLNIEGCDQLNKVDIPLVEETVKKVNVLLLGHSNAGKTHMFSQFKGSDYKFAQQIIGFNSDVADFDISGKKITLNIRDVGGTDEAVTLYPHHTKYAMVAIWVYDGSDHLNFDVTIKRFLQYKNTFPPNAKHLLVRNKIDLNNNTEVSYLEARDAIALGFSDYLECSAITGEGVNEVFEYVAYLAVAYQQQYKGKAFNFSDHYERLRQFTVQRNIPEEVTIKAVLYGSIAGERKYAFYSHHKGKNDTPINNLVIDFLVKNFVLDNQKIFMLFWDRCIADKRFESIYSAYARGANVIIWAFDRKDAATLDITVNFFKKYIDSFSKSTQHILVGDITDLANGEHPVSYAKAIKVKTKLGMVDYLEYSFPHGRWEESEGIDEILEYVAYLGLQNQLKKHGVNKDFSQEFDRLRQFTVQCNSSASEATTTNTNTRKMPKTNFFSTSATSATSSTSTSATAFSSPKGGLPDEATARFQK